MSLNIRNEETHRSAQELAALTGESMTTAVTEAMRERPQVWTKSGRLFRPTPAKDKRELLLFKDSDFRKTDVEVAEY